MNLKVTEKKFFDQTIFKQLIDLLPKSKFDILAMGHKTDRYYKAFPAWAQLVSMLLGVLSRCDSLGEICDGMLAIQGKLNRLGLEKLPPKSATGDGLRDRDEIFFQEYIFSC